MMHIMRDFLAIHPTTATVYGRYYHLYVVAMFLRRVLGFTVVGHTNFNIDAAAITLASGTASANVNLGGDLERAVQLPLASYVVSFNDVDRVLALRSVANPRFNSGLFRVVGIDSVTNSLVVSHRPWMEPPPAETGLSWAVFEKESTVTAAFLNGGNGAANPGYRGFGAAATTSRIVLQSPHSSAWQVRLCAETIIDTNGSFNQATAAPAFSAAPGYDGDSRGDFAVGGRHLHPALFYNLADGTSSVQARTDGWQGGLSGISSVTPGRYYMWGDDATGTCLIISRGHGDAEWNNLCAFGIPEDEEQPVPSTAINRLFSFGGTATGGDRLEMEAGPRTVDSMMGVAFGFSMQPITCIPGTWQYLAGAALDSSIMHDSMAGDGVYSTSTELHGWDLYAGTWDYAEQNGQGSTIQLEPRRMGRFPFARRGRENYGTFSTSPDPARSWLHMQHGIYVPWSGSIVP